MWSVKTLAMDGKKLNLVFRGGKSMNGQYNPGDTVLSNWTLVRLIGEGSFGKVYEAKREDFGTSYTAAVKIITIPQSQSEIASARAEGMCDESVTAYFRSFVEEIVREFALMSELKGTANVVSYEDHAVLQHTAGIGWDILIRMELLTPLLHYTAEKRFTRHDSIKLGIDMCRALELCQKFNIVHRDIKPENIFVSKLGDFKLGDFGIARTVEKTTSGLSKKGTYTYMAPEIYRGEAYGSSVDIYSLGIVLYRLLNDNRAPFLPDYPEPITHSSREAALAKRISGAKLPAPKNADGRLTEIVLKACAYDPKDRYKSPMLMRQELDAILYSREHAHIVYPQGDDAPIKPVDYVWDGETTDGGAARAVASGVSDVPRSKPLLRENTESLFSESVISEAADSESVRGSCEEKTEIVFEKTAFYEADSSFAESADNETEHGTDDYDFMLDLNFDEDDSTGILDFSVYNNGEYVYLGYYEKRPIKWVVYDCDSNFCCLLCEDILYTSRYNGIWEKSEIRKELNNRFFFELFTPEQQRGFVPRNGDMLSIASAKEFNRMEKNLSKKQLKCSQYSWLKENKYYMSPYGWIDELEFQEDDLMFGVRPICNISIDVLEIIGGSGENGDPYILDSKI